MEESNSKCYIINSILKAGKVNWCTITDTNLTVASIDQRPLLHLHHQHDLLVWQVVVKNFLSAAVIAQNSKSQVLKPQKKPTNHKSKQTKTQTNKQNPQNTKRRDLTLGKWVKESGLHRKLKTLQCVPVGFYLLKYYSCTGKNSFRRVKLIKQPKQTNKKTQWK